MITMAYLIMMRMQERSDNRVPLTSQINSWNSESLIPERVCSLCWTPVTGPCDHSLPYPNRAVAEVRHLVEEDVKGDAGYTTHSSSRSGSCRGTRLQWLIPTILLFSLPHEDGVDDLLRNTTTLSSVKQPLVRVVLPDVVVSRQGG